MRGFQAFAPFEHLRHVIFSDRCKFPICFPEETAKTLGLTFPPGILAVADEAIE